MFQTMILFVSSSVKTDLTLCDRSSFPLYADSLMYLSRFASRWIFRKHSPQIVNAVEKRGDYYKTEQILFSAQSDIERVKKTYIPSHRNTQLHIISHCSGFNYLCYISPNINMYHQILYMYTVTYFIHPAIFYSDDVQKDAPFPRPKKKRKHDCL